MNLPAQNQVFMIFADEEYRFRLEIRHAFQFSLIITR
jgi:hypothetical protein